MQKILEGGTERIELIPGSILFVKTIGAGSFASIALDSAAAQVQFVPVDTAGSGSAFAGPFTEVATLSIFVNGRVGVSVVPMGALSLASGAGKDGNSSIGTPVCDWQPATGSITLVSSNGGGEAIALDPAVTCEGLPMLRCTQGSAGTFIANFVFNTPVTLAQLQSLQVPFRVSSNNASFAGVNNSLQIWLNDDVVPTRQWMLGASTESLTGNTMRPGVTHMLSFAPGSAAQGWSFGGSTVPTSTTDLDSVTIARMRIVFTVPAGGAGEQVWIGPITANARTRATVCLTLDGQYISQHQYILPMLEAQGLRCSMALQHNQIGLGGRMSYPQLDRANAWGHELIHHTTDGAKGNGYQDGAQWVDLAAVQSDLSAGYANLAARGWPRGIGYAVHGGNIHPFTSPVSKARQQLVAQAYANAGTKAIRTGNVPAPLERLSNFGRPSCVDPFNVHGARQVSSAGIDTAATLQPFVNRAKQRGEVAIFTFHRSVVSAPSALEILNSELATFIAALGADVRAGLVDVLPFGETCRRYGVSA